MVAKPTYIEIIQGPYKGNNGMHVGKDGELHKILLDNGRVVVISQSDFVQKRLPRNVMITKGPYKGYTGFFKGIKNGKLIIELNAVANTDAIVSRDAVVKNGDGSVSAKEDFSPENKLISGIYGTSKRSKSGSKSGAAAYNDKYEMKYDLPDTLFTVIFTELLATIGLTYTFETFLKHINTLNDFYKSNAFILSTKASQKYACISYIFITLNNQGDNIPYNPNIPREYVTPNDNPDYILYVCSKLGYIKNAIDKVLFDKITEQLLKYLNTDIIKSKVFNRYITPVKLLPKKKSISIKKSPIRFVDNGKIFNITEARIRLKNVIKDIILKDIKKVSSNKAVFLQEYIDNIDNPKYIIDLKENKNPSRNNAVFKYYRLFDEMVNLERDRFYNQFVRKQKRDTVDADYVKMIKDRELKRLVNGLNIFKDADSQYVLKEMIKDFNKIVNLPVFQKREMKNNLKIQTGRDALLTEAVIALSDKLSHLMSFNKINILDLPTLRANARVSQQIPMFMKLSPLANRDIFLKFKSPSKKKNLLHRFKL